MAKNQKVQVQWQDGLGNMVLILDEEEDKKTVRLSDNVDVGWAFAVAGLVVLIIISLFFVARCRLSMFTRKRKRINRPKKKSVVEVKEQERVKEEIKAKEEAPKVMAISAASKDREKLAEKSAKKKTKKDFIIEMIDSALDPVDDTTGLY